MVRLNKKQKQAYNLFLKHESFFISGPGGTGKSFLIKKFIKHYILNELDDRRKIQPLVITAMTGSAAVQIDGQTIHSWAGLFDGSLEVKHYVEKIKKSKYYSDRWRKAECLVIDEVSMLTSELFDKLNAVAQQVRDSVEPMGGLQTILVGDFFQLPPVEKGKREPSFCFESENWKRLIRKNIILSEIVRQESEDFQKMLNEIRQGICTNETEKILKRIKTKTRKVDLNALEIRPTEIYSKNADVDRVNKEFLQKLEEEIVTYKSIIEEEDYQTAIKKDKMFEGIRVQFLSRQKQQKESESDQEDVDELIYKMKNSLKIEDEKEKCKKKLLEQLDKNTTMLPNKLELCVQSQVMLTKNLDQKRRLVNGSRGLITRFIKIDKDNQFPVVKFLDQEQIMIDWHEIYLYDHKKKICMKKKQIPLKLAWAVSNHKCQGLTLDTAIIDIGKQIFTCGQSYVALSRCRSLDKLYIRDFVASKIKADQKVIDFYNQIEEYSGSEYESDEEQTENEKSEKNDENQETMTGGQVPDPNVQKLVRQQHEKKILLEEVQKKNCDQSKISRKQDY